MRVLSSMPIASATTKSRTSTKVRVAQLNDESTDVLPYRAGPQAPTSASAAITHKPRSESCPDLKLDACHRSDLSMGCDATRAVQNAKLVVQNA